tara:strand:- start:920 stop:1210 length:291 start_codon:yes stop_codon:yes gene_type:complete
MNLIEMQNEKQLLNKENWIKYLDLAKDGELTNNAIANDIVAKIKQALNITPVVETPLQWIKSNKVDSGEDLTIYYLPNVYTVAKWMEEYVKKHYSR